MTLIFLVNIFPTIPIYATEDSITTFNSSNDMADYILENLSDFTEEYNRLISDNSISYTTTQENTSLFRADYCENEFSIPLLHNGESVICLDFNGNNGYMIVANDKILKLETNGNLDYIYEYKGDIYFSAFDNEFAYYDTEDSYRIFGHRDNEPSFQDQNYNGTNSSGIITDDLAYLNDKYSDFEEYEFYEAGYTNLNVEDNIYTNQNKGSIYTKNGAGEGNCPLVASHNALAFFSINNKYIGLPSPSSEILINPENDYFYADALEHGWAIYGSPSLPQLYNQIRQLAIDEYGYTIGNSEKYDGSPNWNGILSFRMSDFLSRFGETQNIEIDAQTQTANMNLFIEEFWENDVVIWGDTNDVYGSHDVVVSGATIYKKFSNILGIEVCVGTINMLELLDGRLYEISPGVYDYKIVYYEFESSSGYATKFNFE